MTRPPAAPLPEGVRFLAGEKRLLRESTSALPWLLWGSEDEADVSPAANLADTPAVMGWIRE